MFKEAVILLFSSLFLLVILSFVVSASTCFINVSVINSYLLQCDDSSVTGSVIQTPDSFVVNISSSATIIHPFIANISATLNSAGSLELYSNGSVGFFSDVMITSDGNPSIVDRVVGGVGFWRGEFLRISFLNKGSVERYSINKKQKAVDSFENSFAIPSFAIFYKGPFLFFSSKEISRDDAFASSNAVVFFNSSTIFLKGALSFGLSLNDENIVYNGSNGAVAVLSPVAVDSYNVLLQSYASGAVLFLQNFVLHLINNQILVARNSGSSSVLSSVIFGNRSLIVDGDGSLFFSSLDFSVNNSVRILAKNSVNSNLFTQYLSSSFPVCVYRSEI